MRYIVAVSGGVDSVVLLDMMAQNSEDELIVAHFDHGIRPESADDANFVAGLAKNYGLKFETRREELSAGASEELARTRRYAFLNEVAKKYDARIMTAHHMDDAIETIAINLHRGTGWRGLAVMNNPMIERPLTKYTKAELIEYAQTHNLTWREDSTNSDTKYLRNNLRQKLNGLDEISRGVLIMYWKRQLFLANEITSETKKFTSPPYKRYFLIMLPRPAADEIIRTIIINETTVSPTRPQIEAALLAIKTFPNGKRFQLGNGFSLVFTKTHFTVER